MDVLDKIFKKPKYIKDKPEHADLWKRLQNKNALKENILDHEDNKEMKKMLKKNDPLSDEEIKHIDEWPDGDWEVNAPAPFKGKTAVLAAIEYAIKVDRTVEFFWEPHAGVNDMVEIKPNLNDDGTVAGGDKDDIYVYFKSPRSKISLNDAEDEVTVEVG